MLQHQQSLVELEIDVSTLKYHIEGGHHILLKENSGARNDSGLIYRFKKTQLGLTEDEELLACSSLAAEKIFSFNLYNSIFGESVTANSKLLAIRPEVLHEISDKFQSYRPSNELSLTSINLDYTLVEVCSDVTRLPDQYQDYVTGPTLCIELKPGCGFIHQSPSLPSDHIQNKMCEFCLWKFYGKRMKDWPIISEFCPCDLFSGSRSRMRSALKILLNDPQKYMRILKAGKVVYSGRSSKHNPKEFANLLQSLKVEKFFTSQKKINIANNQLLMNCPIC